MDVTPLVRADAQVIQSYAAGRFRVSGQVYEGAIIVLSDGSQSWAAPESFDGIKESHFKVLLDISEDIDVVLLGCGPRMTFLDGDLKNSLKNKGLSVDVIDTGAACRTYNVLMAEGRRVAAMLFPS